jgi:hypothetical protein
MATAMKSIADAAASHADGADPDQAEVVDGMAIDAARARFIHALYAAAMAAATSGDSAAPRAEANAALAEARAIVTRRHAGIDSRYTSDGFGNATIYPFGYLAQADALCYWQRELVQLGNLVDGTSALAPGCIF